MARDPGDPGDESFEKGDDTTRRRRGVRIDFDGALDELIATDHLDSLLSHDAVGDDDQALFLGSQMHRAPGHGLDSANGVTDPNDVPDPERLLGLQGQSPEQVPQRGLEGEPGDGRQNGRAGQQGGDVAVQSEAHDGDQGDGVQRRRHRAPHQRRRPKSSPPKRDIDDEPRRESHAHQGHAGPGADRQPLGNPGAFFDVAHQRAGQAERRPDDGQRGVERSDGLPAPCGHFSSRSTERNEPVLRTSSIARSWLRLSRLTATAMRPNSPGRVSSSASTD